ncbi:PASTA domain-containing protein [Dactylosporangium sp. CA-139066]|uniref:PASTA domain-containing protein n=1 Tax=Dactylosporangium sp. CA-139066 TaxID=3239930 RepID=UPI003D934F75
MPTNWVVTTAAERIALNDAKQGETTFTVTNPGTRADRVVFEPVPGEGADPGWFTVDEPQRRVAPAASVSFLVKAHVPDTARPGTYELQGRVYSADSAPEESSVLSNRVVFEIAAPPAPQQRKIPWWIIAIAAALVLITAVTLTLVFTLGGGSTSEEAKPQPSPSASGPVTVPDLARLNETQAVFALKQAGLTPGTIRHRNDPAHAESVLEQTVAPNTTVEKGTQVGLVIAVKLSPPTQKTAQNAQIKMQTGKLEWEQTEPYVTAWTIQVSPIVCTLVATATVGSSVCLPASIVAARTDAKSYTPSLRPAAFAAGIAALNFNGQFQWNVAAVDDFGNVGPYSAVLTAQMVA